MSLPVNRNAALPAPRLPLEELEQRLALYVDNTATPTWAGTAAFLRMSRSQLDAHAEGLIDCPDAALYREVLAVHKTHIEAYLEGILTREKGSPAGAQFALKAQHGWEDKVHVELSAKPQLSIIVEGELARLINRSDIVDAEVIEEDDESWLG